MTPATDIAPGVHTGLSFQEYLEIDAVSRTDLVNLMDGIDTYLFSKEKGFADTAATEFGTALHMLILEPARFVNTYEFTTARRTAKVKEEAEGRGRLLLKESDREALWGIRDHVACSARIQAMLQGGGEAREVTLVWDDEDTGLRMKCRLDVPWYVSPRGLVVMDLKSAKDCSPRPFRNSISNYRYHVQGAVYTDGLLECLKDDPDTSLDGEPTFCFLAYEKKEPYRCRLHVLSSSAINTGRDEYKRAGRLLKACMERGDWPVDSETVTIHDLPGFYEEYRPAAYPGGGRTMAEMEEGEEAF